MSNRKKIRRPVKPTDLQKPGAYLLKIEHDLWCPRLQGAQYECRCEPNRKVLSLADKGLN